jgi:hypothetical protein
MDRKYTINSIALKKRFCKDNNLSVAIFDNPYFFERLSVLNNFNKDVLTDFETFCLELEKFSTEQHYFEYYNKVKDNIITAVKMNPEFARFEEWMNTEFKDNHAQKLHNLPNKNLYIDENDDCAFISIDMKKANFSALRHFSPKIFGDAETWEEFVGRFTDSTHIMKSKYIRQVILGACNPGKQIKYEHYLMFLLYQYISEKYPDLNFFSVHNDEILIKLEQGKGLGVSMDEFKEYIKNEPNGIGKIVRVEYFHLAKVSDTGAWYKNFYPFKEKVEFKCLDATIYHQVMKYFIGETIEENDLVFYYNGRKVKFLEPIINPFN